MSRVLKQSTDFGKGKIITPSVKPISILYNEGKPNIVRFSDGAEVMSSCLRCHDAPCMKFTPKETIIPNFPDFPADRTEDVCAAGAMSRDKEAGVPIIDNSRCVECGVCVVRCPVGAIRLVPGDGVIIHDEPNTHFIETPQNSEPEMLAARDLFTKIDQKGVIVIESDFLINDIEKRLFNSFKIVGDQFPNLLARSLFRAVGIGAVMRRKGNNNMRMDLILGPPGVKQGVAEVEFGDEAILNVPRDIIDDIAVLNSRYGWDKTNAVAIIVGDILPNRRSEYWRIIQDISRVLNVRISTISIFALMLAVWNRLNLKVDANNSAFYADCDSGSYRTCVIEKIVGRPIKLSPQPRSLVEPAK